MKQMIQKLYSFDGQSSERMDRKKLKRQSTINSIHSDEMDMTDISQNSLLCGMKDFDKAVQNMEETILVPSRLMDMSVTDDPDKSRLHVPTLLQTAEAYDVFHLLKSVRGQVRRGAVGAEKSATSEEAVGLARRRSTLSSHSLSSLASDASSSSGGGGLDSGHETEEGQEGQLEACERVQAEFAAHLNGLGKCLGQMTDAASYLSSRYEERVNTGF